MKGTPLTLKLEADGPFKLDAMPAAEARRQWADFRREHGFATYGDILTPPAANYKLAKDGSLPLYGLTLSPADATGDWNTCLWATAQCRAACVLVTAGKGSVPNVVKAREVRTRFVAERPAAAVVLIADELTRAVAKVGPIACRLNVASDIRWERIAPALFALPDVRFYDYTKAPAAARPRGTTNYRLTYSVSERPQSEREADSYLANGGTAAVVFAVKRGAPLPATWHGRPVVDGDVSDNRLNDPNGTYIGLRAKGSARGSAVGGFVKDPAA